MSRQAPAGRLVLSPLFPESSKAHTVFREHAKRLAGADAHSQSDADVLRALDRALARAQTVERPAPLRAALYVLTDLARQRWLICVNDEGTVEVQRPKGHHTDPRAEKARIRAQELVKRDEQLREPAARKFITGMESATVHGLRPVSVFSLFRDGRELANSLRHVRSLPDARRADELRKTIDPYLQFVDDGSVCEHTGFRLQDIWRYFRHTWTNHYTSRPGRSMAILVRDRARRFHPVMGIGAIGSPIVQIRERDTWIGWHPETFFHRVAKEPSAELGTWLIKTVDGAIDDLYLDDFLEEQLIARRDLVEPAHAVLTRLKVYGEEQRKLHHRFVCSQDLKQSTSHFGSTDEGHWQTRARTHLYRSKRALSLSEMLRARRVLREILGQRPTADSVCALLEFSEGRQIAKRVLRKAKADRVGTAMGDITVCGAVAPYNRILGGKLVSMLIASPEVVVAYRSRYLNQQSEIASAMAGRPIVRPSQVVLFVTTSLYGAGSSQYNRLRMPAETLGGRPGEHLEYVELGKSEAYGTSHFSMDTVEALVALVQQTSNGQRVNSIFGEGVNPKLRKMREGLDLLKLPTDELLQHGRQRIVYAVPLVRNVQKFLLGMDEEPDYLFDLAMPTEGTEAIIRWWTERWLSKRIMRDEVLAQIEEHTLVRPIRHGARAVLPAVDDGQGDLLDDLAW